MDINEARKRIQQVDGDAACRCSKVDGDLHIERSIAWSWRAMPLGTTQIDMADRDPYDTIPPWETIGGMYEQEPGCSTCGYGSVLIVRGVLTEAAPRPRCPGPH